MLSPVDCDFWCRMTRRQFCKGIQIFIRDCPITYVLCQIMFIYANELPGVSAKELHVLYPGFERIDIA
jgi:hypothetical protein